MVGFPSRGAEAGVLSLHMQDIQNPALPPQL
jgi:hypothetical protein